LLTDPPPPERGTAWAPPGVFADPTTVEEWGDRIARDTGRYQARQTGTRANDLAVRMSQDSRPPAAVSKKPPAQIKQLRKQAAEVLLEKIALLQPTAEGYYMSTFGPLGAAKAPPGSRLSTFLGSAGGLGAGYYAGKAIEKAMLERMSGKSGKAGKALALLAKFPTFLTTGAGSVLGARAAQSM